MLTRREEIIWLAGLLEGEGCFDVHKHRSSRSRLRVRVKMTDKDVIERARAVFPTSNVLWRAVDKRPRVRDCWLWAWNGTDAEKVMRAVLPYMGERRQAAIRDCLATPNLSHHPRKASA